MLRLVLREGAKVGDVGHAWLAVGLDDHPADMGPEEAMVHAIRVKIRVSIVMVHAVATGMSSDVGITTGIGAKPNEGCTSCSMGVGSMTGGDMGTMTACSHKDGWHVRRLGGSLKRSTSLSESPKNWGAWRCVARGSGCLAR